MDQRVPLLLLGFFFQRFHHFRGKDRLRQLVADAFLRCFLHGGPQHQDFAGNTGLPQLHAFLRQRRGEVLRAHGVQGGRHLRHAVTVGVGLDDRHDFRISRQQALLQKVILADLSQIHRNHIVAQHLSDSLLLAEGTGPKSFKKRFPILCRFIPVIFGGSQTKRRLLPAPRKCSFQYTTIHRYYKMRFTPGTRLRIHAPASAAANTMTSQQSAAPNAGNFSHRGMKTRFLLSAITRSCNR